MKKLGVDQWGDFRDEGWNIRSNGEVANAYKKQQDEVRRLREALGKYRGQIDNEGNHSAADILSENTKDEHA
jgi:hypothetical protein